MTIEWEETQEVTVRCELRVSMGVTTRTATEADMEAAGFVRKERLEAATLRADCTKTSCRDLKEELAAAEKRADDIAGFYDVAATARDMLRTENDRLRAELATVAERQRASDKDQWHNGFHPNYWPLVSVTPITQGDSAEPEHAMCWSRSPGGSARCSIAPGHNCDHVAYQDHDVVNGALLLTWPEPSRELAALCRHCDKPMTAHGSLGECRGSDGESTGSVD